MKEIVWQEFNKSDRLVTKRKSFKSGEAILLHHLGDPIRRNER